MAKAQARREVWACSCLNEGCVMTAKDTRQQSAVEYRRGQLFRPAEDEGIPEKPDRETGAVRARINPPFAKGELQQELQI